MKAYKGFDKNLKCRSFQYEVGKTYEENNAVLCKKGFHACENPLDVFGYYPPGDGSRYCEVELEDVSKEKVDKEDSKVCSKKIRIGAEIGLKGIVDAFVKFVFEKVKWTDAKATNTGYWSAATNTGDRSAATNTGDWSAAVVGGKESIAISTGFEGKARGALGCYIVIAEWGKDENGNRKLMGVKSHKVDGEVIKPDVFYVLKNGEFVEVK